jgi:hypothetical protein
MCHRSLESSRLSPVFHTNGYFHIHHPNQKDPQAISLITSAIPFFGEEDCDETFHTCVSGSRVGRYHDVMNESS